MNLTLGVLLYSDFAISELVPLAQECETLGFDYLWYTDVRFARECYVALATVAGGTKRIRIGPGVTDPYSRHPAITASAIATLDEVSGGRAVLGLGVGGSGFRQLGLEARLPVAAMRETVETVRGLLQGEQVTARGKVIALSGGQLSFKPLRDRVPIYFATHGPQMTRLAGEVADGVLIANTLRPDAFAFYLDRIDEGLAKAGRPLQSFDVGLRVEASICEDDEAAMQVMRRRVASRVLGQHPHWEYLEKLGIELPSEFAALGGRSDHEAVESAAALLPMEVVESMVLAGSPERVAEQLARALGPRITQLTLRPHAVTGQSLASVVRSFAEQVVPRALQLRAKSQAA